MTNTTREFKRQLPVNATFQSMAFLIRVGVGIWLVPYLVDHLGTAAYGLIPIAALMTQYASLISNSISVALNRYLTMALHQGDPDDANRVYSTAFFTFLTVGALQAPLFALAIAHAGKLVNIPDELYRDAQLLLVFSAAAFIVNLMASVYTVPMYAFNRLDISRGIDMARILLRLVGIVAIFGTMGPALKYVGYVDLGIALICLFLQRSASRRLAPALAIRPRFFEWPKVRQVSGLSGWLLVNQVGSLLFLQMDVWVCNRFVDPASAGQYAALLHWPSLLRQGGLTLASVVAPMIMIYYTRNEMEQLVRLSTASVRILSLAISVAVVILCTLSGPLLGLWLGDAYMELAPLMMVMLLHLAVNVGVTPLFNVQVAVQKVKLPAVVTLVGGIANLMIAIYLARYMGWGLYGVAAAGAIVLTAKNFLFTTLYAAYILQLPWLTFMRPCISAFYCTVALGAMGYGIVRVAAPESLAALVLTALAMGLAGVVMSWFLLPGCNRNQLYDMMRSRLPGMRAH